MPDETATTLLARAQSGDPQAFADLVDPCSLRLSLLIRRLGVRVLGADQDHEDLLQVVLARAWRLLPTFEDRGVDSFYRWLVALTHGALGDRKKYVLAKGRGDVRHLESSGDSSSRGPGPRDLEPSVSRIASRHEEIARALAALEALPPQYRPVVEEHLLRARTLAEIAEELGVTRNAIWERLHRGLALLRTAMGPSA